jgi:hypothetical protein
MLVRSRDAAAGGQQCASDTVRLSEEERARLHTLIGQGVAPARALTHARILLKANQGEAGPSWTDAAIAVAVEVNPGHRRPGPHALRRGGPGRRGGPQAARAPVPPHPRRGAGGVPGRADLQRPTRGRKRWTLRLLAERLVALELVESVSYETVRQALQQTSSSRG